MTKRFLFLVAWLLCLGKPCGILNAKQPPGATGIITYDASYAGLKFATIEFSEGDFYRSGGKKLKDLDCWIESRGFINVNGHYRSTIGEDYKPVYFESDEASEKNRTIRQYWIDSRAEEMKIRAMQIAGPDTTRGPIRKAAIDGRYLDSVSLIFRIRDSYDSLKAPVYLNIFVDSRPDSVLIESVSASQVQGPDSSVVPVTLLKGLVPFLIYPGFGKKFEIYLPQAGGRMPLKARLEMALGFIEIVRRND